MSEQVQQQGSGSGADKALQTVAVLLVIAGIAAYYVLAAQPGWIRWLGLIVGLVLAAAAFGISPTGRGFWRFVLDSRIELRKVVWPVRQETLTMTAVVFGFLGVAGLFFWVLDLFLAWATKLLTGQGS
ncbi:MAG: preprotein translocase subunit SecE [Acetobacteraceae bacterium]|nr:preprotein translocase subunit SecE [Acetobacteraceae bacterium]